MILPAVFFLLFAVAGYVLGGQETREMTPWRAVVLVLLAVALSVGLVVSSDVVLDLILTVLLAIFAASAGGLLTGIGVRRLLDSGGRAT